MSSPIPSLYRLLTLGFVGLTLGAAAGCRPVSTSTHAPSTVSTRVEDAASAPSAGAGVVAASAPGIHATIAPLASPEPLVRVELRVDVLDDETRTLRLPGPVAGEPRALELEDADGPVLHSVTVDERKGVLVSLERPAQAPLTVRYVLSPAPARIGATARLEVHPGSMFATGEALLLLPETTLLTRQTLHVRIDPTGLAGSSGDPDDAPDLELRALSTFADDSEFERMGLPYELLRAGYVAGHLEHARFDSRGGDDRFAAVGSPSYDTRWIAAEIAGLRSEVDLYFQQRSSGAYVTLLAAGPAIGALPHHVAELRGRGLVVSADVARTWDAQARLAVATTLVRRWIGGRLRMVENEGGPSSAAWALWFHGGVSRFVARELLLELGLLTPDEYRAELDSIELMLATSPLRDRPLSELVARVDDPDPRVAVDARASLVARGVMYATWVDARLRATPSNETIAELLGMVVALAVVDDVSELTLGQWLGHVRGFLWEDDPRADFEAVVVRGERPKLGKSALGPCFRARSATLRRFELGFVDGSVDGVRRALLLDPRGSAAKAGVRPNDEIVELSYDEGDAMAEVSVTVARGQADRMIRYRPAGPPLPGTRWIRVAGVSDERCVR